MNSWPNFKSFRPKLSQNRIKIGEVSKFDRIAHLYKTESPTYIRLNRPSIRLNRPNRPPQSLVQAVPTEQSGTLLDGNTTWTLQFLIIQYFPSPLRSVPQSSSSYGAERSTFGWEHHLNIAISLAIQYLPSPLCAVPKKFWNFDMLKLMLMLMYKT